MIDWIIREAVVLTVVEYGIGFVIVVKIAEQIYNRCKKCAGIRRRLIELGHKPEEHL